MFDTLCRTTQPPAQVTARAERAQPAGSGPSRARHPAASRYCRAVQRLTGPRQKARALSATSTAKARSSGRALSVRVEALRNVDWPQALLLDARGVVEDVRHQVGAVRLIQEAMETGTRVGVCGSEDVEITRLVLERFLGEESAGRVAVFEPHEENTKVASHPASYTAAAAAVGAEVARCVVVEVSQAGIAAARAAGMRCIALGYCWDPAPSAEALNAGLELADAVFESIEAEQVRLEDLATPGAYWINPPLPRDDEGNWSQQFTDPQPYVFEAWRDMGEGDEAGHYRALGFASAEEGREASDEEVKAAFRRAALAEHPDRAAPDQASQRRATRQFQQVLLAYQVLRDKEKRAKYY